MADVIEKGFLQSLLNNGCITKSIAEQILRALAEKNGKTSAPSTEEILKSINEKINPFGQSVSLIKHPIANEFYVVFGFLTETVFEQFHSNINEFDRKYFSKLISIIVLSDDYSIHWSKVFEVADNLSANSKKISKSNVQELLDSWTLQGYFITKDDKVYLGPRLIFEFENNLKRSFPDCVKDCPLCEKLVLWDTQCSHCQVRFHRDCIRKYLRLKSNCPSCKNVWNTRLSL